jgi:hypothetical protein
MVPLILVAVAALQATDPMGQTEVAPVTIQAQPDAKTSAPLSDKAIEDQLNDLVKSQPDRMVCLTKAPTGTRIKRPLCATLRQWYDFELARGVAEKRGGAGGMPGPPYELVDLIKSRLANSQYRAMAEARAAARLEAEANGEAAQP